MALDHAFRALVEERLGVHVPIRTRAMFGGFGVYSGDLFFALIAKDKLYLKVGDLNEADFEAAGMEPFYPYDSPAPMRYWELPPSAWNDPAELAIWVDKAIAVAANAKRKRKS